MEPVLRAAIVYFSLLIFFRVAGRRTLAQLTNFDFVLLLIIGEAIQNGLLGNDFSITHALVTVVSLISIDILLSILKQFIPGVERAVDGGFCSYPALEQDALLKPLRDDPEFQRIRRKAIACHEKFRAAVQDAV